jgi:hypothetical protein
MNWMMIRRAVLGLAVVALSLGLAQSATAQTAARPNIAALVYSPDSKVAVRLYEPGKPDGRELYKVTERMNILLSSDTSYMLMYGTVDDQGTFIGAYGKSGDSKTTPIVLEKGYYFIGGSFSPSNKFLAYTQARLSEKAEEASTYILSVVEVATNKVTNFTGTFASPTDANNKPNPLPPTGFYGGPLTVGWLDDSRQVISPFFPFSEGNLDGLYIFDSSKATAPTLTTTALSKAIPGFALTLFAPDNKRVAYLYNDPSRNVPNFEGPYMPFNTVGVIDVTSGKLVTVPVPKDNAAGSGIAFTPDGTKVLYVAGLMQPDPAVQGSFIRKGKLYTLDVASGTAVEGPVLTPDEKSVVNEMEVCGNTLFMTVSKLNPDSATSILLSAPLANPAQQTTLYSGLGYVSLVGCAP